MTIENAFMRIGGQDLRQRFRTLNVCVLNAARRAAADRALPTRIRFPEEIPASIYAKLTDIQIGKVSEVGVFLFRPSLVRDAFSHKPHPSDPPDNELVRLFLLLARDLSRHNVGTASALIGTELDDRDLLKRLTDLDFEVVQTNLALTFEPRFVPPVGGDAEVAAWKSRDLLDDMLNDMRRLRTTVRASIPAKELERA